MRKALSQPVQSATHKGSFRVTIRILIYHESLFTCVITDVVLKFPVQAMGTQACFHTVFNYLVGIARKNLAHKPVIREHATRC